MIKGIIMVLMNCYHSNKNMLCIFTLSIVSKKNNMGILRQIGQYLYIVKKDPNDKSTQWMKYMHGINRLSILLFIFAMIVLAIKLLRN